MARAKTTATVKAPRAAAATKTKAATRMPAAAKPASALPAATKPAAAKPAAEKPVRTPPAARKARVAARGDTGPTAAGEPGIENFAVAEAVDAAQEARLAAMRDLISGAPLGEASALLKALIREQRVRADTDINPDDELNPDWRDGGYPYRNLMQRRTYERQKYRLQVELLKLQAWVKETGQKVVILFEEIGRASCRERV